jgi:hypothetical protein
MSFRTWGNQARLIGRLGGARNTQIRLRGGEVGMVGVACDSDEEVGRPKAFDQRHRIEKEHRHLTPRAAFGGRTNDLSPNALQRDACIDRLDETARLLGADGLLAIGGRQPVHAHEIDARRLRRHELLQQAPRMEEMLVGDVAKTERDHEVAVGHMAGGDRWWCANGGVGLSRIGTPSSFPAHVRARALDSGSERIRIDQDHLVARQPLLVEVDPHSEPSAHTSITRCCLTLQPFHSAR